MPEADWGVIMFIIIMGSISEFTIWLEYTTLAHSPPISVHTYLEGVNNSTYIYFIRIFTLPSQYWSKHNTLTIYSVEAYTGNTTVNCIVKPQLPITISNNYAPGPECPAVTLVLYCPTPISNATVNTNYAQDSTR
jgi:hypothetical protein